MRKEIESLIKKKKQISFAVTMKGKKIMVVAGAKSEKGKVDPPVSVTGTADEIEAVLTAAMIDRWTGEPEDPEKKVSKTDGVGKAPDSVVADKKAISEQKEEQKPEEPKKEEDLFAGWV